MPGDFPRFPMYREPWLDCPICGNSYPRHMMQRHYKKGFLVDKLCADARAHDDYMAELIRGRERPDPTEQKVANQGSQIVPVPSDEGSGAGGGGAGGGGAG